MTLRRREVHSGSAESPGVSCDRTALLAPNFEMLSCFHTAGKSTLMKYIYEDPQLRDLFVEAQADCHSLCVVVGYFFHEIGTASERTFVGLLNCIITKICKKKSPQFMPHISELYQRRKENHANVGGSIWDEMSLKEALKTLLDQDSVQGTVCLIIDGLDECHEGEDEGLEYLLDLIDSTASKTLRVRACISSRPLPLIEDRLRGISGFRIQEWTAPDISKYVSCKMDEAL